MKLLLSFAMISLTSFIFAQGTSDYDDTLKVFNANLLNVTETSTPNAVSKKHFAEHYAKMADGKEVWYDCPDTVEYNYVAEFQYAYFTSDKTVYTVVYGAEGKWLATESRVPAKGEL
ncbi:MAG: hypothetical protein JKY54_11470, partial [Flavobacteriales bacterium]|nr:hypothetical protein [Flavobacteriales bacterium]